MLCTRFKKKNHFLFSCQEDSDEEDFEIQATDNLLAVGCSQKDSCLLEFYGKHLVLLAFGSL